MAEVVRSRIRELARETTLWPSFFRDDVFRDDVRDKSERSDPVAVDQLRGIAVLLSAELEAVQANASAARLQLASLSHLPSDLVEVLLGEIAAAEAAKTSSLELELVAVDHALEHAMAELDAICAASDSLSDADIAAGLEGVLERRTSDLFSRLGAIPRYPVSDGTIEVALDEVQPYLVTAAARLEDFEPILCNRAHPRPGDIIVFSLRLLLTVKGESAAGTDSSNPPRCARPGLPRNTALLLERLLNHEGGGKTHVVVTLGGPAAKLSMPAAAADACAPSQVFRLPFVLSDDGRGLEAHLPVPLSATPGEALTVQQLVVGGRECPRAALPPSALTVHAVVGLTAPMTLPQVGYDESRFVTPCVSADGTLFIPSGNSVAVYAASGNSLPDVISRDTPRIYGFRSVYASAFDDDSETLLLGESASQASRILGINARTGDIKWARSDVLHDDCFGVAVLRMSGSQYNAVVASSPFDSILYIFKGAEESESGRACLQQLRPADAAGTTNFSYIAADASTGCIYASAIFPESSRRGVVAWSPHKVSDACADWTLRLGRDVSANEALDAALPKTENARPLAVMPPAPGSRTSYLVVGQRDSGVLHVLALPSMRLVHVHDLGGDVEVGGLAADAAGSALVFLDKRNRTRTPAAHVLPWPLDGMPALE